MRLQTPGDTKDAEDAVPQRKLLERTMANGWTPERKARQAMLIQRWKPWQQSTGPRTLDGKAIAARNPYKGRTRPLMRQLAPHVDAGDLLLMSG